MDLLYLPQPAAARQPGLWDIEQEGRHARSIHGFAKGLPGLLVEHVRPAVVLR